MSNSTVVFQSKFSEHVLTRIPKVEGFSATGQRTVLQMGERVQFKNGKYVARAGRNVHQDSIDWLKDDADPMAERDEVEALKAHREFGTDFWLEGWSPAETRQLPRPQDFRRDVIAASAIHDTDAIQRLLAQELTTHGRGDLVQIAQDALATIEDLQAASAEDNAQNAPKGKEK